MHRQIIFPDSHKSLFCEEDGYDHPGRHVVVSDMACRAKIEKRNTQQMLYRTRPVCDARTTRVVSFVTKTAPHLHTVWNGDMAVQL